MPAYRHQYNFSYPVSLETLYNNVDGKELVDNLWTSCNLSLLLKALGVSVIQHDTFIVKE